MSISHTYTHLRCKDVYLLESRMLADILRCTYIPCKYAVSSLKASQSFKEKRSSSAPGNPQVTVAPPSGDLTASTAPGLLSSQHTSVAHLVHRRSLPTSSKVINEEGEGDLLGPGQELGHGSIGDNTISGSLESLDEPDYAEVPQIDDELFLRTEEPEAWSVTVDKKITKKMTSKDIKRQDTIWELIQTERHHCRTLKILQKIYSPGIQELQVNTDKLFPRIDDLIDVHMTFLRNLQDLQNLKSDHSIEEIGPTLVDQFEGDLAERMKVAYGAFCSGHKDAVSQFKELSNKDRKFANFVKRCNNHPLCKKREIPDFILLVTQRPSKYPTLIGAILKSTKDKKDRENLIRALQLSKDILENVNAQVDAHERQERLMDIYGRMDSRSTTLFKGRKFKRSDILSNGRQLIHEGPILWKNARAKVTEVIAVVLTDIVFFIQESNQKYAFFTQDSKPSVISLFKLIVREKADSRDSKGIFLINQNKMSPEMYELVCRSSEERQSWIKLLRSTVEKCPEEEEEEPTEIEEDRRKQEERSLRARKIIEQLHLKDLEIKQCCDEKNNLFVELLEVYGCREDPLQQRPGSREEDEPEQTSLQAAIQEVSRAASQLTTMLQGSSNNLSRSVSSAGEHVSHSYTFVPMPKRAETFAGFDSSHEVQKAPLISKKKYESLVQDSDSRSSSPSLQNLDKTDSDSDVPPPPKPCQYEEKVDDELEDSEMEYVQLRHPDNLMSRGKSSSGDMSITSASSLTPSTQDQMVSLGQLSSYLHTIVHLTAQQGTAVESLRAQLAEANDKINKLSVEVHERKTGYRHNQLEELRNLQENIRREKQEWEREKERAEQSLEREQMRLEQREKSLEKQEMELRAQKDELKRQREVFQRQIDMLREQGKLPREGTSALPKNVSTSSIEETDTTDVSGDETSEDTADNTKRYRRSASAEFYQTVEDDLERLRVGVQPRTLRESQNSVRTDVRPSVSSVHSFSVAANKPNLPVHLLSARNEQKVGKKIQAQQIPSKLAAGLAGLSAPGVQQTFPHKLSRSSTPPGHQGVGGGNLVFASHSTGQLGGSTSQTQSGHGHPPLGATHSASNLGNISAQPGLSGLHRQMPHSRSNTSVSTQSVTSPGSLSLVMKLAEPGMKGRERTGSQPPHIGSGDRGQQQSAVMETTQSGSGGPGSRDQRPPVMHKPQKSDSEVIYF